MVIILLKDIFYDFDLYHLQVLTKEYYGLQTTSEKKNVDLEAQISELRSKLQTYEKLEKELDDVVMQAAESRYNFVCKRRTGCFKNIYTAVLVNSY